MVVGSGAVDRNAGLGECAEARDEALAARQARLGGARADFVAGLGARVGELGASLRGWQADPWSSAAREDLQKRLHALAAGSRLLRFTRLADDLVTCERVVDLLAPDAALDGDTSNLLRGAIARAPALAWGETSLLEPARGAQAPPGPRPSQGVEGSIADLILAGPLTALVVGPAPIADALLEMGAGDLAFEVERTDDAPGAAGLARAFAPDVVVVDVDVPGAGALIGALFADPLTEAVPVIAIGSWTKAEDAALYVALGVARTLARPVSPDVLRAACAEASATYLRREVAREPIGAITVDKLGARLAEELRRGLCDAVDPRGRGVTVDLGEGDEVLAALWGAVARIRDLVTIRSGGAVHFSPNGPEGALPVAPWLGEGGAVGGAPARSVATERSQGAPGLDGMVAIVADDDPAVTWFLAGALRAAGATVHEARDGAQALELAFRHSPDLVVSDVLMPKLDGFAVCRALKRDVVLRDIPVVLLSWKEDLLQRVRELGADADGYLLKEASAGLIVQRVREVLRPRYRVAQRLAGAGEVRGRVDGLTARTLLAFTCAHRPFSTLVVRDASFLYEVEIRAGRPTRATRTATHGAFERGPGVLASLLGVGAGRFVVSPMAAEQPARGRAELTGSLGEQLLPHVALARAAQRLLSGAALLGADRVGLVSDRIAAYVDATPEPARGLLRALALGESPRALLLAGQVPARLLEDVLCDAAAHGAVASVFDTSGVNLLPAAIEREESVLLGQRISEPPPALSEPEGLLPLTPFAGAVLERPADEESGPVPTAAPDADLRWTPEPTAVVDEPVLRLVRAVEPPPGDLAPPLPPLEPPSAEILRAAADQEVAEACAEQLLAAGDDDAPGVVVAPKAPRSAAARPVELGGDDASTRVPGGFEPIYLPLGAAASPTPTPSDLTPAPEPLPEGEVRATLGPVLTLSFTPPPAEQGVDLALRSVAATAAPDPVPPPKDPPRAASPSDPSVPIPSRSREESRRTREEPNAETPSARRYPRPSAYAPEGALAPPRKDPRDVRFTWWIAFAAVGVVFAVGARWSRDHGLLGGPPPAAPPALIGAPQPAQLAAQAPVAPAPVAAGPSASAAAAEPEEAVSVQDLPLKPGDKLPAGQGRLEIVAGSSDMIYVDGQMVGKGPVVRLVLAPKTGAQAEFEVRVKLRGEDRVRYVAVKEGRLARVRVAPPWSR